MQVKTSELTGLALDWVVVYLECLRATNGKPVLARALVNKVLDNVSPSTDWSQGGPIIEREFISLESLGRECGCNATIQLWNTAYDSFKCWGQTPLIAAMRCYVASKLGDVVDIPDELIEVTK